MALEWEEDGNNGRLVRSPLKFKIGVPQLNNFKKKTCAYY